MVGRRKLETISQVELGLQCNAVRTLYGLLIEVISEQVLLVHVIVRKARVFSTGPACPGDLRRPCERVLLPLVQPVAREMSMNS